MKKESIAVIFVFILSYILTPDVNAYSDDNNALSLMATIPAKSDSMYIGMTLDFTVDKKGNIWICDQSQSKIHQFSSDFEFITSIGDQPGQGPGEFINPANIFVTEEELIVTDMPNRVQILDRAGDYKTSFMKVTGGLGIVCNHEIILVGGVHMDDQTTMEAYDRSGKVIKRFGEFFEGTEELNHLLNLGRIDICNNKIYFSYLYYPEVRVYDSDFGFISKITFNTEKYKKLSRDNINFNYIKKSPNNFRVCKMLFIAFDVNKLGIFFIARGKDIVIDHFDFDGKPVAQYEFSNYEFAASDMHVEEMANGNLRFYILGAGIKDYIPVVKVFECTVQATEGI